MKKYIVRRLKFNPKVNRWDNERLASEMEKSINEVLLGEHELHTIYESKEEIAEGKEIYEFTILTIIYSE